MGVSVGEQNKGPVCRMKRYLAVRLQITTSLKVLVSTSSDCYNHEKPERRSVEPVVVHSGLL